MLRATRRARSVRLAVGRGAVGGAATAAMPDSAVAVAAVALAIILGVSWRSLEDRDVLGPGGPVDVGGGVDEWRLPGDGGEHEEELELGWQALDVAPEEGEVGGPGGEGEVDSGGVGGVEGPGHRRAIGIGAHEVGVGEAGENPEVGEELGGDRRRDGAADRLEQVVGGEAEVEEARDVLPGARRAARLEAVLGAGLVEEVVGLPADEGGDQGMEAAAADRP